MEFAFYQMHCTEVPSSLYDLLSSQTWLIFLIEKNFIENEVIHNLLVLDFIILVLVQDPNL